jgi:hypothetical protein
VATLGATRTTGRTERGRALGGSRATQAPQCERSEREERGEPRSPERPGAFYRAVRVRTDYSVPISVCHMPTDADEVRLTEARRTFDRLNETVRQQANHTIELVKINLLLLGSVPLAGLLSRSETYILHIAVVILISTSIGFQMREYSKIRFSHGVNTDFIRTKTDSDGISEGAIQIYSDESSYMTDNNHDVARNLFVSILLTVFAVIVLLLLLIP